MSKHIIDWSSGYVRSCFHEMAERCGDGLYCVYLWEDENGETFYVGSGKGYRFNSANPTARSAEFMERYNNSANPHPRILAYGMSKDDALDFEKKAIEAFSEVGFPLVNKAGVANKTRGTITYNGRTRTLAAWGRDINVSSSTIKQRINKLGWPLEKALFTPSAQDVARQERKERLLAKQAEIECN